MTLTDWLIPQFVRFQWGYGYISLGLAILSFGMSIVTMLTVKGIYVSMWMLIMVGLIGLAGCLILGYLCEKYDIQNRISSHTNNAANPEFKKLCEDVTYIKRMIENEGMNKF